MNQKTAPPTESNLSIIQHLSKFLKRIDLSGKRKTNQLFIFHSVVIGIMCGLAMALFQWGIQGVSYLIFGTHEIGNQVFWLRALLAPMLGGLIGGLILRFITPRFVDQKEIVGSGIPQLKIAYSLKDGQINTGVIPFKLLLGSLFIGSGSSVGMQGPVVQMGGALGCLLGKIFKMDNIHRKEMVPVGVAGGVAAAFNTPIAAVVFTLEEMVGAVGGRIMGSTIIASVSAAYVSHTLLESVSGSEAFLARMAYQMNHPSELFFYVILGLVCGFLSLFIIIGILRLRRLVMRIPPKIRFLTPAVGGLLVGIIAIFFPQVMGLGLDSIREALSGNLATTIAASIQLLLIIAVFKIVATMISYSTGAVGGLLAPSLFIGAMVGSAIGVFTSWFYDAVMVPIGIISAEQVNIEVGAFALVGMGAMFAGVTRVPMTSILLIMEMTFDYSLILPLMIANILSFIISHFFYPRRLYESFALQDGVHLPDSHMQTEPIIKRVKDALLKDYVDLEDEMTVKEAMEEVVNYEFSYFPVMNELHHIVGMITRAELIELMDKKKSKTLLRDIVSKRRMIFTYVDQPLHIVLQRMGFHQISVMPVVNRLNPRQLEGLIAVKDIMNAFGIHEKKQMNSQSTSNSPTDSQP